MILTTYITFTFLKTFIRLFILIVCSYYFLLLILAVYSLKNNRSLKSKGNTEE